MLFITSMLFLGELNATMPFITCMFFLPVANQESSLVGSVQTHKYDEYLPKSCSWTGRRSKIAPRC